MNKKIKKIGKAVAGSALLVGATLTGAAGLASAASGTQNLGDYPHPFVSDNGQVQSTVVVGQNAKTIDVVGAINIAGSLGNAAFKKTTKSVSVSGGAGGSWSASNGVTLDTQNDNLYFGDNLDAVRDTLTGEQLSTLEDTTFRDDNGDETDVENYLYPGNQQIKFGKPDDRNNQDPVLYVENPSNPDSSNHLYELQANFEDSIKFTADDVEDEEITLFGNTYTVSKDTDYNTLVLYGSQQTTSIDSGSSKTVTINGKEHTIEVVGVTTKKTAAFRVDGELKEKDEDDKFTVDGQEVRVDDVIQTNADQSQGTVQFAIGSEELRLEDGNPIEDGDGNDIDGTKVQFKGDSTATYNNDDSDDATNSQSGIVNALNSVTVYVGAENDDKEYVMAGESYTHSQFQDFKFSFGGLNPDATSDSDSVSETQFRTTGDDTATVQFSATGGDSATLEWSHGSSNALQDDDSDAYHVVEGADVKEDEYFPSDAGDFAHMWEVTSIDVDSQNPNSSDSTTDEATVTLTDAVTGQSVDVDIDEGGDNDANQDSAGYEYQGTEVIDGQTYNFAVNTGGSSGESDDVVTATWGTGSAVNDAGAATSLYTAVDTDNGASLALAKPVTLTANQVTPGAIADAGTFQTPTGTGFGSTTVTVQTSSNTSGDLKIDGTTVVNNYDETGSATHTFTYNGRTYTVTEAGATNNAATLDIGPVDVSYKAELPSTESTDAQQVTVANAAGSSDTTTVDGVTASTTTVSGVEYEVDQDGTTASDVHFAPLAGATFTDNSVAEEKRASALFIEEENDNDNENAFTVVAGYDGSTDNRIEYGKGTVTYTNRTGTNADGYSGQTVQLESDSDVNAFYNLFGTYTQENTDEQGSFTVNYPAGQSTAGAAFTTQSGSLSASGGAASGSVTAKTPTGWPDAAALDSDISGSDRSQDMILVGGPAVNTLVKELASSGKTQKGSDYSQGQAVLDYVNNAFQDGQDALVVAGYSGSDTRQAANYLANYADHQSDLAGKTTKTLTTQQTVQ